MPRNSGAATPSCSGKIHFIKMGDTLGLSYKCVCKTINAKLEYTDQANRWVKMTVIRKTNFRGVS